MSAETKQLYLTQVFNIKEAIRHLSYQVIHSKMKML